MRLVEVMWDESRGRGESLVNMLDYKGSGSHSLEIEIQMFYSSDWKIKFVVDWVEKVM